jgi:hypothetical protein
MHNHLQQTFAIRFSFFIQETHQRPFHEFGDDQVRDHDPQDETQMYQRRHFEFKKGGGPRQYW